ncbi:hypothetical protein VW23_000515 [Devosia insulae DS-56]|uniref:Uncharacterized protein n=1 Tax=Devosia insulae DS-56 TaxID=1116389 RepID=A0A1E5XHN0_9HYPH|nr:hypothetical protein [Devosia insulae]OEO28111.1 hypothetical protein VW23_000515 [Devosia insulae DS-56]
MPTITRRQLHVLVWSEPLEVVSRSLGFPVARLRSLCRSNDIDLPPPGYWAKVAAGAPAKRRTLRTDVLSAEEIVSTVSNSLPRTSLERAEEVHSSQPVNDPPPVAPDFKPTTALAREVMRAKKSYDGMLRLKSDGLELKISPSERLRSAALIEALVLAGAEAGWSVGDTVSVDGEVLVLELRERTTAPVTTASYVLRSDYVGTGDLVLSVSNGKYTGVRHNWSDTRRSRIEARLPRIVDDFSAMSAALKERRREREEQERRWAEQERIRKEERRLAEVERVRGAILREQADAFDLAQRLRQYVEAVKVRTAAADEVDERSVAWIQWAERHVADLDPLHHAGPVLVSEEEAGAMSWQYRQPPPGY